MKSPPVTSCLRRPKPDAGHRPVTFSLSKPSGGHVVEIEVIGPPSPLSSS